MLHSRISAHISLAQVHSRELMGGASIALALCMISFAFRMWIFRQRSHFMSLDIGEVSVSQSHHYSAKRGPNPLEPPLRTALCTSSMRCLKDKARQHKYNRKTKQHNTTRPKQFLRWDSNPQHSHSRPCSY